MVQYWKPHLEMMMDSQKVPLMEAPKEVVSELMMKKTMDLMLGLQYEDMSDEPMELMKEDW